MVMMQVGDCVISTELFDEHFLCDLARCKGECCVQGESGAPLQEGEDALIEKNYPAFKKYLRAESVMEIEKNGFARIDLDRDLVTPLLHGNECVYAIFENGIAKCAIEKAYLNREVSFRKPISCHMYPLRAKPLFDHVEALNYHVWKVCDPARECGLSKKVRVYEFVKDALVRKYGQAWYNELKLAAGAYLKEIGAK